MKDLNITVFYLREQFELFNKKYFENKLPVPHFIVNNSRNILGQFSCERKRKRLFGAVVTSGYTIKVSEYFKVSEQEYNNVLLHEMIHFYIVFNNLRDTSSHGRIFRSMMNSINADGW